MITAIEYKKLIQTLPMGMDDAEIPLPTIEDFDNFPSNHEIKTNPKKRAQAERVYRLRFNDDGTVKE